MDIGFNVEDTNITLTINKVVIAGWTGRNMDAVQHHIDELAALGISPPSQVPLYYRVSNSLLTQSNTIEVLGEGSSGEVEPFWFDQMAKHISAWRQIIPTEISKYIQSQHPNKLALNPSPKISGTLTKSKIVLMISFSNVGSKRTGARFSIKRVN